MALISAGKQAQLAQQLQSRDADEVQAGLSGLNKQIRRLHKDGLPFDQQLPVLAAALPQIVPSLLQLVQAADASDHDRLAGVFALVYLITKTHQAVANLMSESDLHTFVCVLADLWTLPRASDDLFMSFLKPCVVLLEAGPNSLQTANVFCTRVLPRAMVAAPGALCHDGAQRVALPVLVKLEKLAADDAVRHGSQLAEQLVTVAGWDIPGHITALLESIPPSSVPPAGDAGPVSLHHLMCILESMQALFMLSFNLQLQSMSEQQTLLLLQGQRDLWQCARSYRTAWEQLQPVLASDWRLINDPMMQAAQLLRHGWMPVDLCRMDARAFGAATAGNSNAQLLVSQLTNELTVNLWWQALCFVQLGMPHSFLTMEGVRALLKAGLVKGIVNALLVCINAPSTPNRLTAAQHVPCLLALSAWYAERFPAVRTAIAAEHLTACGAQAKQQTQKGVACSTGTSTSSSSSTLAFSGAPSPSLWSVLQQAAKVQGLKEGCCQQADCDAANSALPVDYSRLGADESAALPVSQLRCLLDTPPLAVSMAKLQRLVGQQLQMLQTHASAERPSTDPPAAPTAPPTSLQAAAAEAASTATCQSHSGAESAGQVTHGSDPALPLPTTAGSSAAAGSSSQQEGAAPAGSETPACVVCSATQWKEGGKLQLCAGCASVRYCSSTCQKHHWKQGGHRQACKLLQAAAAAAAELQQQARTLAVAAAGCDV